MAHLGAQLSHVQDGYCEISVPFDQQLSQQHGFFHAGVISTIIDNTAGYAALTKMAPDSTILTVEYKVNFLAPGDGELLIGRGKVVKYGRTLTICRAEAFVVKNGKEKLCAIGQCTLMEMAVKKDN